MRPTRCLRIAFLLLLALPNLQCRNQAKVVIDTPLHGDFVIGTMLTVTGHLEKPGQYQSLAVNGLPVTNVVGNAWSLQIPIDPSRVFQPIQANLTTGNGFVVSHRINVIVGDGITTGFVLDGEPALEGAALRLAQAGLDQIEPVVESLSGDSLDVSDLITGQNPIATGNFAGLIPYVANAVEVDFASFALDASAVAGGVDTTITIQDFFVELDLDLDWLGSCTLEIQTASTTIQGSYDLEPLAAAADQVDVNLTTPVVVALGGFSSQFVSGICDDPLIGDIINLILGQNQIQQLMQDGFEDNLADPDGAGPLDSPIAAAIQDTLAGISIAGPLGDALGGTVDAPIAFISEDVDGLTIAADVAITSTQIAPEAPDLVGSYTVDEPFPTFPATTPVAGLPYGMAFGIQTSALNQLLKTQIEGGLLQEVITEFAVVPGGNPVPLTAGLLALFFIPEMQSYDPNEPVEIRIRPTLAPIFTGQPGPAGEFAQLRIGALEVDIVLPNTEELIVRMEVDIDTGVDLTFTSAGLGFALGDPGEIGLAVTRNPLGTNVANLLMVMEDFFPAFAPALEGGLEAFPLPSFLGLDLQPVEISRLPGGMIGLFADLVVTPTTTLSNVVFSDFSSGDGRSGGGCWIDEWRHRLSGKSTASSISASLKGMLGADSGCTTNDNSRSATVSYRVAFDVVSVPGEEWTVDLDHALLGAFTRISDAAITDGGGTMSFTSANPAVQATYQVVGGSSGSFGFDPSVLSVSDGTGGSFWNAVDEFSGANGVSLVGTGDAAIEVDVVFDLYAFSDSYWLTVANGDELAIRFGKNDTIDNNFTAGQYPGMGNRNIADDGHELTVTLSSQPLP